MKSGRHIVLRVVIDTNIWISATINPAGPPAAVVNALIAGQFSLIISQPLIDELVEVLERPRIGQRYGISADRVRQARALLSDFGLLVPVVGDVTLCRDPDDNVFLETALRGQADVLVSRDEDLTRAPELAAALREAQVEIMTVRRFLEAIARAAPSERS